MELKKTVVMGLLLLGMGAWMISCSSNNSPTSNPTATPTPAFTSTPTPTPNVTVIANFGAGSSPAEMAVDSQNSIYVALSSTVSIGEITSAGVTSTINTTTAPWSLSVDAAGDIFFSGSNAAGVTELLYAGSQNSLVQANTDAVLVNSAASTLYVSNGINASAAISIAGTASVNVPIGSGGVFGTVDGMTMDAQGNLFFADVVNWDEVGEITATSLASGSPSPTLVAGPGTYGAGFIDGAGASAKFNGPEGIAVDSSDNLYVADNANGAIRKISGGPGNWTVSTLIGPSGITGISPTLTMTIRPDGVAVDSNGTLYFDDATTGNIYRYQP